LQAVYQPTRGEQVPMMVRQAWKTMVTGRPGPVVLDVPFDIFKEAAAAETPKPEEWNANISSRCGADPEGVVKAVDMLLVAERPVILVGQGVKYGGGCDDLLALAERCKFRSPSFGQRQGAIDSDHPLSLGLLARGGAYQANGAARQADVLLALGVRFDDRTSSSWIPGYSFTIPPTKLIHVDIDPEEIGRNYPVALGLMADVPHLPAPGARRARSRRKGVADAAASRAQVARRHRRLRKEWDALIAPGFHDDSTPIHPQRAAPRSTRRCPTTPSWSATSASTTTG
jgi:acetolactate synthase I/II/III large subunit